MKAEDMILGHFYWVANEIGEFSSVCITGHAVFFLVTHEVVIVPHHMVEFDLESRAVNVLYTNHRGEKVWRRVFPLPRPPEFMATEHYDEPQWILHVFDLERKAERSYALKDIHEWKV